MTDLRAAARQALELYDAHAPMAVAIEALRAALAEPLYEPVQACWLSKLQPDAYLPNGELNPKYLQPAPAEPEGGGNLPPPLPGDFDHGIGADRFKVVRGAFWWHVLIGDSPTEHGKFRSRAGAEKMAADLLREFRNGAFVQHKAALAEPPVDDPHRDHWVAIAEAAQKIAASTECSLAEAKALCAALDRLTDAALAEPVAWRYRDARGNYRYRGYVQGFDKEYSLLKPVPLYTAPPQRKPLTDEEIKRLVTNDMVQFARAIERAHEIGEQP